MAISESERIFDLAYAARMTPGQIASILPSSQKKVEETLANLALGPSTQVSPALGVENTTSGIAAQLLGNYRQVGNTARLGRSNADYLGLAATLDQLTGVATKFGVSAPITVRPGDVISKIGVLVGGTLGKEITHAQAALYEGKGAKPVLLAESSDTLTAEMPANNAYFWTLKTPLTITEANAPNGFIYANYVLVSASLPSLLGATVKKETLVIAKKGIEIAGHETPLFIGASNKPAAEEGEKPEAKLETTLTVLEKTPYFLLV